MKIARARTSSSAPVKSLLSVHGNSAVPEYPESINEISRKGWGSTFWGKESTTNWFHIPFSFPILENGLRPKLVRISLCFHNTSRSPIKAIHLYDGTKLLRGFNQLNLFGDHAKGASPMNTFTLDEPAELQSGFGISVMVNFPQDNGEKPPRWILFTSALAEFQE